jgi:hypothetical protein
VGQVGNHGADLFLARRRVSGLICLAVAAAMGYAIYVIFVP